MSFASLLGISGLRPYSAKDTLKIHLFSQILIWRQLFHCWEQGKQCGCVLWAPGGFWFLLKRWPDNLLIRFRLEIKHYFSLEEWSGLGMSCSGRFGVTVTGNIPEESGWEHGLGWWWCCWGDWMILKVFSNLSFKSFLPKILDHPIFLWLFSAQTFAKSLPAASAVSTLLTLPFSPF